MTAGLVGRRHTDPWSYWPVPLAASVGHRFYKKPHLRNKVKSNEKDTQWSREETTKHEMIHFL